MKKKRLTVEKSGGFLVGCITVVMLLISVFLGLNIIQILAFGDAEVQEVNVFWYDKSDRKALGVYPKGGKNTLEYDTYDLHAKYDYVLRGQTHSSDSKIGAIAAIYLHRIGEARNAKQKIRINRLIPFLSILAAEFNYLLSISAIQVLAILCLWGLRIVSLRFSER